MGWERGKVRYFDGMITAPAVNDDKNDGYRVSDIWIDEIDNVAYRLLDSSVGAAVWDRIANGISGPASALDNEVPVFDGVSGKKIKAGTGVFANAGSISIGNTTLSCPYYDFVVSSTIGGDATFRLLAWQNDLYFDNTGSGDSIFRFNEIEKVRFKADGRVHITNGAFLATGSTGSTPVSGWGARMMWVPDKYAFRAGFVDSTQWDAGNIGDFSFACGYNGIASGQSSLCFGSAGVASGVASTHFGYGGIAAGDYSLAAGANMQLSADADRSFAFGYSDTPQALTLSDVFYLFPAGYAGKVAIGTSTPATSAAVDITSTIGALLLSRMTTNQKTDLTPVNGMILYDNVLEKFQGYENGAWGDLGGGGGGMTYLFIKALTQAEGDIHLAQADWGVSKALIASISVVTASTDWDLYLLQNDNGFAADDANIPKLLVMQTGSGDADILLNLPYEDEDGSNEVHLYFLDNSGANTADIYIRGTELI